MVTIRSYKAQAVGDKQVDDLVITFIDTLPSGGSVMFTDEAERIARELGRSLPGGLYDALAVAMMRALCSALIVPRDRHSDRAGVQS